MGSRGRSRVSAQVAAVAAALMLAACSASPSAPRSSTSVKDEPGVVAVRFQDNDGDNDDPSAEVPKRVMVLMEANATASQVENVFEAYRTGIDDGTIQGVEVELTGAKKATLATGGGVHATERLVGELLQAQHDDEIVGYRREAFPVLPSVQLTLAADFDQVVSAADRYRKVLDIDLVEVVAGNFMLTRDRVNEDLAVTDARQQLVQAMNRRFRLTGAYVSGRGPLKVAVTRGDKDAVLEYLERNPPPPQVGRTIVRTRAYWHVRSGQIRGFERPGRR